MALGDKLKAIRLQKEITQEQVAKRLGSDNNTYISAVENNRFTPSEEKLRVWAEALYMSWGEMQELLLEIELEEFGIKDPAFTMMFKDIPDMTYEEKQSIIRAYQAVLRARESKNRK